MERKDGAPFSELIQMSNWQLSILSRSMLTIKTAEQERKIKRSWEREKRYLQRQDPNSLDDEQRQRLKLAIQNTT